LTLMSQLLFLIIYLLPLSSTLFPYTTLFRSAGYTSQAAFSRAFGAVFGMPPGRYRDARSRPFNPEELGMYPTTIEQFAGASLATDRKSTRLNSSHVKISYAVFCLKKKRSFTY